MAAVETAPQPSASLRGELAFVKQLLANAKSVDELVAAANAASRVANNADRQAAMSGARRRQEGGSSYDITIRNLPADGWDWRRVKTYIMDLGIKAPRFVKKDEGSTVAAARFDDGEGQRIAISRLAGVILDGSETALEVVEGFPAEYSSGDRAKGTGAPTGSGAKRGREEDGSAGGPGAGARGGQQQRGQQAGDSKRQARGKDDKPAITDIRQVVCPWWSRPYGEQLQDKVAKVGSVLCRVLLDAENAAQRAREPLPQWVVAAKREGRCHAAELQGIIRSPAIERYRNKSEFTVGLDTDGKPCVGFLLGAFVDGYTATADPGATRHTSAAAVLISQAASGFLRDSAKLPAWDKGKAKGFWRLVTVRESRHKPFLPAPATASSSSTGARLQNPPVTFSDIDPWAYLLPVAAASAAAAAAPAVEGDEAASLTTGNAGDAGVGGSAAAGAAATAAKLEASEAVAALVLEQEPVAPHPDDIMVLLQVHRGYREATAEEKESELLRMAQHITAKCLEAGMPAPGFQVQDHSGVANAAPFDAPVADLPAPRPAAAGSETTAVEVVSRGHITEALVDLKFRISPTAFFQVNTPATCLLYAVAGQWAAATPSTLLLDICCGTGTIGISLAHKVTHVIGIDNVPSAIDDARHNAAANGVTNAEFICGKAEDALEGVLSTKASSYDSVVAIADPPRAGLHKSVAHALLRCTAIKRMVYVACNADTLAENLAVLCGPQKKDNWNSRGGRGGRASRGGDGGASGGSWQPFTPVKAVAVDLFPHTPHVETVVLLERQ